MNKKLLIALLLIAAGATTYLIVWLDKQLAPQISKSRTHLLFIAKVYPLLPTINKEKNVVRTIKMANLLATSQTLAVLSTKHVTVAFVY